MTSVLHLSDTHGSCKPLIYDAPTVVHSGDFLPSFSRGLSWIEEPKQTQWLRDTAPNLRAVYGDRKLLVVPGNHDFVALGKLLREEVGLDATCLTDRLVDVDGVGFYGFSLVPFFGGEWNYEAGEATIAHALGELRELMESGVVDVLVSHSPIHGVLDKNQNGEHCGSTALRDALLAARHPPKVVLHGHIHESFGATTWNGILVSNAAMGQRVVKVGGADERVKEAG